MNFINNFLRAVATGSLACLALSATSAALACSPVKSIGVVFDLNSAVLPAKQVLKLANWTALLRTRYPNREAIFMTSQTAFGERDANELGLKRTRSVARILQDDLQFDVQAIHLPTRAYAATKRAPEGSDLVKRVDVEFLPACPHECPCQMGDPLYNPLDRRR